MDRATALVLLASLTDEDLSNVVGMVRQTVACGEGWLTREPDGRLRQRVSHNVVITERQ